KDKRALVKFAFIFAGYSDPKLQEYLKPAWRALVDIRECSHLQGEVNQRDRRSLRSSWAGFPRGNCAGQRSRRYNRTPLRPRPVWALVLSHKSSAPLWPCCG